jgi:hypothetical protein
VSAENGVYICNDVSFFVTCNIVAVLKFIAAVSNRVARWFVFKPKIPIWEKF